MSKLSAVILTKNTEENINRCIKSLEFCEEIIIVEDSIKKQELSIKNNKIKVFYRTICGDFASQRNFGMEKAKGEWVLYVDSDEVVTVELKSEIVKWLNGSMVNENAFYIKRRDFFWGKELKFGETKKAREQGIIRLVKKGSGKWEGKVHEKYNVKAQMSNVKTLRGFINHYPHQTVREFIESVNFYSSLRSDELYTQGKRTNIFEIVLFPFVKFILTYFFKLGFLDGPTGFVYSFFMSFHSFLVRIKLYQKCF